MPARFETPERHGAVPAGALFRGHRQPQNALASLCESLRADAAD